MQFTSFTLAAFAVAAYAGDVTVYTTCTSTRTVERVVATAYVSSNSSTSAIPSASPSPYSTNTTIPAVPTSVQPTQPAEATHTNGATALGFQAAGLAAIAGAVGLLLA